MPDDPLETRPITRHSAPSDRDSSAIAVRGLSIAVEGTTPVELVTDVTFTVGTGETFGIVGESGSGKTMTSLALMGLLPAGVRVTQGSITVLGREIVAMPVSELEDFRGRELAMIFQDALRSLNPAFTVGDQIAEVARRHLGYNRRQAMERAVELLDLVGIPNPTRRARDYPHMFSGGMCQRAMIAMALVCEPKVLIADEPTTALDVTIQAQVLDLLLTLQERMHLALMFITHDLGVVAEICDRVAVMYAGQVVEVAPLDDLFRRPQHPYTAGLLDALPSVHRRGEAFGFIPGVVPSATRWPAGCRFNTRCGEAVAGRCSDQPIPLVGSGPDHLVRCCRASELTLAGVEDYA